MDGDLSFPALNISNRLSFPQTELNSILDVSHGARQRLIITTLLISICSRPNHADRNQASPIPQIELSQVLDVTTSSEPTLIGQEAVFHLLFSFINGTRPNNLGHDTLPCSH